MVQTEAKVIPLRIRVEAEARNLSLNMQVTIIDGVQYYHAHDKHKRMLGFSPKEGRYVLRRIATGEELFGNACQ
jgi:hypothetical protein